MIARLWRGWTTPENADAYLEHLRRATLPEIGEIDGHCGAYVLRRDTGDAIEFIVLTLWDSLEAVRAFAGQDDDIAVVPSEAQKLLTRFEKRVLHYQVALERFAKD
jgi:heme-degrading monooxygenase HmoA